MKDEEVGGELWRPRRRAMSCSSSRYSSRSLVGLLSAARPASFIESYSGRSPANPSSSVAYRPSSNEDVFLGPTRPASYTDTHPTSICTNQASPLFCRTATIECILPGAAGSISPEELAGHKDSPVRPMAHMQGTVSDVIQHPTLCGTNITVISEHPIEVRNCDHNIPHSSAGTDESGIKMNSSSTDNIRTMLENKYMDKDARTGSCERSGRTEDNTRRTETETDVHLSSHIVTVQTDSKGKTVHNTICSVNFSQTPSVDSSVKSSISGAYVSYSTDIIGDKDTSHKKSIFINCPQHRRVTSPEVKVMKYLKGSTNPTQSNVAYSTWTTNDENKGGTVLQTQREILCSENKSAQNIAYNDLNAIEVINSEYPTSCTFKRPIKHESEKSLVNNLVYSSDLTCSIPAKTAQYFPPHQENIHNQEPYSVDDTTVCEAVPDSNASTVNHNTDMHLHKTDMLHGHDDAKSNHQKEAKHPILNETTCLSSSSSKIIFHSQNTRDSDSNKKQDCVVTISRTCREKYEAPKDFIITDYSVTEEASNIRTFSVASVLSLQTDTTEDTSILELASSPSSSVSNSTVKTEQSIDYQIMESPDTTSTVSSVSSKSACSSISVTSTSSMNTLNSSNTFPPSTAGSPVH